MSRAKRKAEVRAHLDAEERHLAIAVERDVDAELQYPGVGVPLLRLALVPSFSPASVFEIRDAGGELVAYRSRGSELGKRLVTGHERIQIPEESLRSTIATLQGVTCAISVAVPQFGVADADVYSATFFLNFETSIRVAWCSGHAPVDWKVMVQTLERFRALCENAPEAV